MEMRLSDGKTIAQRIDELVAALGEAVQVHGGVTALSAELERPLPEVSRRVNRADDGKGTRMEPFLVYLAFLDDEAFERWHNLSGAARGFLPAERARRLTGDERAEILASALSDEAKRSMEKRRGLPSGSLG